MTTTAAPAGTPGINPSTTNLNANAASKTASDVAWAFIPQYYTHMNEKPERLHRFYTKNSSFLHGVEGEDTGLCHGQAEIHKRITELEYKDCKVFIHCVDAQASIGGGILVNVIGEISNNAEQWRKFVQTFFLAEQQGGYYVHNDNFRYLKEEAFTDDEDDQQPEQPVDAPAPAPVEPPYTNGYHPETEQPNHVENIVQLQDLHHEPPKEPTPEPVAIPEPREPTPLPVPDPITTTPEVHEPAPDPVPASLPSPSPSPVAVPASPAPVTAPSVQEAPLAAPSPSPATPASIPAAAAKPPTPVPVPAPITPSAPKTWANLAAANSSKWGHNVASEAKGVSAAAPPQPHTTATPRPAAPRPAAPRGPDLGPKNIPRDQQHQAYTAALQIITPQCFVKGVTENIPEERLIQILTQLFGPIKECEVVRSKACAFLEFKTLDAAKRAIIASLPPSQGGDGGIKLDEKEFGAPARLNIEIRKERGERPPPRPRGGAPISSAGHIPGDPGSTRGTFRGSPRGRGRGETPSPGAGRGAPK